MNTLIATNDKNDILTAALELIKSTGFENVTLNDVTDEMRIGEQNIYELFSRKAQLIEAVVEKQIEEKRTDLRKVRMRASNSIEQVFLGWNILSDFFKSLNNEVMSQLKKFSTQSFKLVSDFKNIFLYEYLKLNIETGITQGLYRHNIKPELLSRYLIEILQVPVMPGILQRNRLGSVETEDQLLSYHLYGIATQKGIKLIRKYKNDFLIFTSRYR